MVESAPPLKELFSTQIHESDTALIVAHGEQIISTSDYAKHYLPVGF